MACPTVQFDPSAVSSARQLASVPTSLRLTSKALFFQPCGTATWHHMQRILFEHVKGPKAQPPAWRSCRLL